MSQHHIPPSLLNSSKAAVCVRAFVSYQRKKSSCIGVVPFSPCYYRVRALPWEGNIATGILIFLASSGLWHAKVNRRPLPDACFQGTPMRYLDHIDTEVRSDSAQESESTSNSSMFGCEILILLFVDAESSPSTQLYWPAAPNQPVSQGWSNPKISMRIAPLLPFEPLENI